MTLQFLKGCGKRHGRLLRLAPFVSGESTCLNKGPEAFSPSTHLSLWQQTRTMATKRRQHRHRAKANVGNRGAGIKASKQNRGNPVSPPKIHRKRPQKSKEPLSIPPSLLVPTASPYVYISGTALGNNTDDEFVLDPSTLFAEVSPRNEEPTSPPPLFAKGDFHYFSPKKDLNYKYPNDGRPEVAFLGRSNVGKSSLINALMRKNLCLTSRTPGRTQLPYYYGLVPKGNEEKKKPHQSKQPISERRDPSTAQGFIVDLPGYGYGRAPTSVAENWQSDTQELLLNRRHEAGVLQRLYLLMDSRRGMEGPNEHDRIVMRWLEDAEIPFTVVLTKADRVSVPLVVKQVNDFCLRFAGQQQYDSDVAQSPVIHVTSSTRGWGIHELMLAIETEFCGDEEDDDFMDPYDTESI